jgi:hypothetical protein
MRRLLAAAVLAAAPAAHAADFTLRVPVTITNVPSASQLKVDCYVSKVAPGGVYAAGAENVVGRGYSFQPVSGGAFAGTITVTANAGGIVPPSAARSYGCSLTLYGHATTGAEYAAQSGNLATVVNTATGQTLTEVVATVSGPLAP